MDGDAASSSLAVLYDVAGGYLLQLVTLQCSVLASQGQPLREDCPKKR